MNNKKPGYKMTPLGWIPAEWEVLRLKEILNESKLGGNYENAEANTGVPVIKMGNLDRGRIKLDKIQFLPNEEKYNKDDILKSGDLLFNTRNTLDLVGKVAVWRNELQLALYNSNLLRMHFIRDKVYSNYFMNYLFNSQFGIRQLRGIATGTTSVAAIYGRDLENVIFPLPPLGEQKAIARVLSTWDEAIEKTQELIKQKELRKKWLMQQLLTGKKRLKGFKGDWQKTPAGEVFQSVSKKANKNEELLSATQDMGIIPRSMLPARVTMPSGDTDTFKLVEKGNFVISLRSFQGGLEYSHYKGLVSPAYTVLTPRKKIVDEFYKQYFKSYEFIGHLSIAVIGIRDGKQISYDDFCLVKIPCPDIQEQAMIAKVLQKSDNAIELLNSQLKQLILQKTGLMQALLTGKKRVTYI